MYHKTDITQYSDQELSMLAQNEEHLYNVYCDALELRDFSVIENEVEALYEYTEEQLEDLRNDFDSELEDGE